MRFVGIVLLIGLVAGCSPKQPVPVRIGYVETDVPSSSQCVEITGAFQGRPYQLRMAYSQNGKVSYKILNETPCFMQDTVLRLQMAVEPVHKHTARFTLNVDFFNWGCSRTPGFFSASFIISPTSQTETRVFRSKEVAGRKGKAPGKSFLI